MKKHTIYRIEGWGRSEKKIELTYYTDSSLFPMIESPYGTHISLVRAVVREENKVEGEIIITIAPPPGTPLIDMRVLENEIDLLTAAWFKENPGFFYVEWLPHAPLRTDSLAKTDYIFRFRARCHVEVPEPSPAMNEEQRREHESRLWAE